MARALTEETRSLVLKLYVHGEPYDRIAREAGVSKATITAIISQKRGEAPDIDDLRKLAQSLDNVSIEEAMRGTRLIEKLNELNIALDQLPEYITLLERTGEEAPALLSFGRRLKDLEDSEGRSYREILDEFSRVSGSLEQRRKSVETLAREEKELRDSIDDLRSLVELQAVIRKNRLAAEAVQKMVREGLELEKLGFTLEVADSFAKELKKSGSDPLKASVVLGRILSLDYPVTEEALAKSRFELQKVEGLIKSLNAEIVELKRQRENVKDQVERYRGILAEQHGIHDRRMKNLGEIFEQKKWELEVDLKERYDSIVEKKEKEIEELKQQVSALEERRKTLREEVLKEDAKLRAIRQNLKVAGEKLEKPRRE